MRCKRLIDLVGPAHARMILYTAKRIDAAEAERIGLINRMTTEEDLNDVVLDIARTIADNAPLSIAASKLTINEMLKDESQRDMAAIQRAMARPASTARTSRKAAPRSWKSVRRVSSGDSRFPRAVMVRVNDLSRPGFCDGSWPCRYDVLLPVLRVAT